jgi:hypothetical protein
MFKRGYIWRVGNVERISIWKDPWIPSSPNMKVITLRGTTIYNRVADLIDLVTE